VEPGFGLFVGGGDLGAGHSGGEVLLAELAVFVALGDGQDGPEVGFREILRDAASGFVIGTESGLSRYVTLVGGALIPLNGLRIIAKNTFAVVVANTESILRVWVALVGSLAKFLRRMGFGFA